MNPFQICISYIHSKISSPTAAKATKANLAFSFPPAPVNGALVGVSFAVPTTVPLPAPTGTPLTLGVGAGTGVATTCATTVAVPRFEVQFGYATGKLVAVGIVYVGLTKVGT
jgi:hypothetical protein